MSLRHSNIAIGSFPSKTKLCSFKCGFPLVETNFLGAKFVSWLVKQSVRIPMEFISTCWKLTIQASSLFLRPRKQIILAPRGWFKCVKNKLHTTRVSFPCQETNQCWLRRVSSPRRDTNPGQDSGVCFRGRDTNFVSKEFVFLPRKQTPPACRGRHTCWFQARPPCTCPGLGWDPFQAALWRFGMPAARNTPPHKLKKVAFL